MQMVIPDNITKGVASETIARLVRKQAVLMATPNQIAILLEANPSTPEAQLKALTRPHASKLISKYLAVQNKKKRGSKNDKEIEGDATGLTSDEDA